MNDAMPWADIFEQMHKRASSANVMIENSRGELLILKAHYKPYWSLPGGLIDEADSPRSAATREAQEEIGLTIQPTDLEFACFIDRVSNVADTYLFVFRLIDPVDPAIKIRLQDDEIAEYDWVSQQQVRDDKHGDYSLAVKNWAADLPETYLEQAI